LRYLKVSLYAFVATSLAWAALQVSLAASPRSMPIPPEIDADPPEETAKLVFIHASIGHRWLADWLGGGNDKWGDYWDISLGGNNYFVSDYNAHNHSDLPGHGYCTWPTLFSDPAWMDVFSNHNVMESSYDRIADPGGENTIIMIKPCGTQYPIYGNPDDPPSGQHGCPRVDLGPPEGWKRVTVGNVKQALLDTLEATRQHPDKFFVLVTAPPQKIQDMSRGENARAIANWMVHDMLDGYDVGNVMVFDLFNVLTSNAEGEGDACQEWPSYPVNPESGSDVGLGTGNHHRIWGGGVQHQVGYDQIYMAYCWGHPAAQGSYKMTVEFVPLLNAYYNAWVRGRGLAAPTAVPTTPSSTAVSVQVTEVAPTATPSAESETPAATATSPEETATPMPATPAPSTGVPPSPTAKPPADVPTPKPTSTVSSPPTPTVSTGLSFLGSYASAGLLVLAGAVLGFCCAVILGLVVKRRDKQ
jgi:hypothetical protein